MLQILLTVDSSVFDNDINDMLNITFNMFPSPPGVSQSSSQSSGPLASFTTAGNLRRLCLNTDNQTGLWEISVNSNNPYSVKVIGQ